MEETKPHCCTIGCETPPAWGVYWGDTPDDYTHTCTTHVGMNLHPGRPNTVINLAAVSTTHA